MATGYETNTPVCGYPKDPAEYGLIGRVERRIVAGLLATMRAAGVPCTAVNDGEEITPVATDQEALDLIFNLDDAYVVVGQLDSDGRGNGWVRLVLGNGADVISDYTTRGPLGPLVEAFDVKLYL